MTTAIGKLFVWDVVSLSISRGNDEVRSFKALWKRHPDIIVKKESGKRDSNPRPLAWEANALPTELLPHHLFHVQI